MTKAGAARETLRRNPELLGQLRRRDRALLATDWEVWAHAGQTPPEGDWNTWVVLGGRGGGKTRAGAQWLETQVRSRGRTALVGQSLHDVREVMVEGPSGLLALPRRGKPPRWEASRRRLVWPNGATAQAFSAEDADALRGPQFGAAWADEWCAWRRPAETLALLRMGLRIGERPRLAVTTTPRPTAALRRLLAEPGTARTDLPTRANAANLSLGFLHDLEAVYGGTRLAAQELEGRLLDGDGALFSWEMMRTAQAAGAPPARFERVVVAVDPPATSGGAACGIVAAGRCEGVCWILGDRTVAGLSPLGWAGAVKRAAETFGAGCVVAEVNQGGEMVETVLRTAGVTAPVRRVHARHGKRTRAEPVAALYEQGRVRHAAPLPELEDALMALGAEDGSVGLDRADALVWAVSDLMLGSVREGPRMRAL